MRKVLIGIVVVLVAIIALAYFLAPSRQPLTADRMVFVGKWVDQTGDTLIVRENGSGDYQSPSFSVTGGSVFFKDDTLIVQFSAIKKAFTITKPPSDKDATLVLDQVVYTRWSPAAAAATNPLTAEKGAELNAAMAAALYNAIEADDAKLLHAQFALTAQRQLTADALRQSFSAFFNKALLPLLKPALEAWPKTANITAIDNGNFAAENVVALANGQMLTIKCDYLRENGAYKPFGLNLNLP